MFKNCLHIPAQCDHNQVDYEMSDDKFGEILADANLLQQLRRYFMMLTHYSELTLEKRYGVSAECSEFAQAHFVQTRKEEAEQMKQEEEDAEGQDNQQPKAQLTDQHVFHHWLILSRLITVSQGAVTMDPDHFKQALELDD